jgi:hypothetical protein
VNFNVAELMLEADPSAFREKPSLKASCPIIGVTKEPAREASGFGLQAAREQTARKMAMDCFISVFCV